MVIHWHFLFWRKLNLDESRALAAAVWGWYSVEKVRPFWKKGFRSKKSNTLGLSAFLSALTGPYLITPDPWCVSVSRGSCSAAFSGMWVLWESLIRLCCTKEWHRGSTLGSLRAFWELTQDCRTWGRCLSSCCQLLSCRDSSLRQVYLPFITVMTR